MLVLVAAAADELEVLELRPEVLDLCVCVVQLEGVGLLDFGQSGARVALVRGHVVGVADV